jgi:hypothetical protein
LASELKRITLLRSTDFTFLVGEGGFFFSPTRLFAPQLLKFLCCLNRSPNLTLCALFVLASCLLLLLAPREAHGCVVLQNMPKKDKPVPAPPPAAAAPAEQFDMVFHCQLAHGSPTRQIRDFANVKQLYEAIGKAFGIKATDVSGNASGFFCVFFWFFFSPGRNSKVVFVVEAPTAWIETWHLFDWVEC